MYQSSFLEHPYQYLEECVREGKLVVIKNEPEFFSYITSNKSTANERKLAGLVWSLMAYNNDKGIFLSFLKACPFVDGKWELNNLDHAIYFIFKANPVVDTRDIKNENIVNKIVSIFSENDMVNRRRRERPIKVGEFTSRIQQSPTYQHTAIFGAESMALGAAAFANAMDSFRNSQDSFDNGCDSYSSGSSSYDSGSSSYDSGSSSYDSGSSSDFGGGDFGGDGGCD